MKPSGNLIIKPSLNTTSHRNFNLKKKATDRFEKSG
jgi:hypothetical protein